MFGSDNFVVTVGNFGAIVALHSKSKIKNKIFLNELNDESKKELSSLFDKNAKVDIYILFDTVDQTYKKKTYPAVKKSDLYHIIKRDINQDEDKESMKSYILLNHGKKTTTNRWECFFISCAVSDIINNWIEFLLQLPNRLVGIYMLPIESFNLFSLIKSNIKLNSKIFLKRNQLYCIIAQNKVSGVRQMVFNDTTIVFTRIVNYDFQSADFLEKFEQDLYSTFEYLKRLFPELIMGELDIINIFSEEIIQKLQLISNVELNYINYTPAKIAEIAGFKGIVPENSSYLDLVLSKAFFSKKRKILKFTLPKIKLLEKFFYGLKFTKFLNIVLFITIFGIIVNIFLVNKKMEDSLVAAERKKVLAMNELAAIKASELDSKSGDENYSDAKIDEMNDIGKIHEVISNIGIDFADSYFKLGAIKNFDVYLSSFVYTLNNFNNLTVNQNIDYKIDINGEILNKSGDVEDLFKGFDGMIAEVKKTFDKSEVKYTELPRNIDFAKKYYDSPVQITITKQ
jgi:hypothetical protein